ncbi:MAG: MarR family transcriptional regulator [Candidatus Limnocylindrales bacterium]
MDRRGEDAAEVVHRTLGEQVDGQRIGTVAARVGVTLPATGRLLRRLERRGLVALATDEADRRATRAQLTADGLRVRTAILEFRRTVLGKIAADTTAHEGTESWDVIAALAAALGQFA